LKFSYHSFGESSAQNMAAIETELTATFLLADTTILNNVTSAISQDLFNFLRDSENSRREKFF
jgi:hypothetical protein